MDLPSCARDVMAASRRLPWGIKAVWIALLALDNGPEGAWISDASLAERVGLDPATVKNYRFRLRALGLARTVSRPGGRAVGWIVQLPAGAHPGPGERIIRGARAVELAGALDAYLSQRGECDHRTAEVAIIAPPKLPPSQHRDCHPSDSSILEGEDPAFVLQSEAPLPTVVSKLQKGVVPYGTHQKRNSNRRPSSPEQEEITLLTKHDGGKPLVPAPEPALPGIPGTGPGSDWQRMKDDAKRFHHVPDEPVERQA